MEGRRDIEKMDVIIKNCFVLSLGNPGKIDMRR